MSLRFEDFELLGKLSDDGLWETWLARAARREAGIPPLAFVKRIPSGRANMRELVILHRQVGRAAKVKHNNLLPVLSHGKQGDDYLVLRAASPAEALASVHQRHINRVGLVLAPEYTISILRRVISVFATLHHAEGDDGLPAAIVHGAMTPGAVLLDYRGGVQVVDPGLQLLSRAVDIEALPERLWRYYPPESFDGTRDARSDVYSIGAMAWELLTGQPLFGPCAPYERPRRVASMEPPRLSAVNPDIPYELDEIVARSLAKNPDRRYADAAQVLSLFDHAVVPLLRLAEPSDLADLVNELFADQRSMWSEALRAVVEQDADRAVELFRELLRGEAHLDEHLGAPPGVPMLGDDTQPQQQAYRDELSVDETAPRTPLADQAPPPPPAPSKGEGSLDETLPDRKEPSIQISESLYEYAIDVDSSDDLRLTNKVGEPFHEYEEAPPRYDGGDDLVSELEPEAPVPAAAAAYQPQAAPEMFAPSPGGGDEDEDEEFFEPFPIERVITHPSEADSGGKRRVVEVIKLVDHVVTASAVLSGIQRTFEDQGLVVKTSSRKTTVSYKGETAGTIRMLSGELELIPSSPGKFRLTFGEQASIEKNGAVYLIRYFRPPDTPARVRRQDPREVARPFAAAFGISLIAHLIGLGAVLLTAKMGVSLTIERAPQVEVFAEGRLEKPKTEPKDKPKPKPKPKPPKPKKVSKPAPVKADPTEQKPMVPKSVRKKLDRRLRNKPQRSNDESKADSLVAALTTPVAGEGETVSDTVTNIDAVKTPGQPSALRVAGTIAAIEGSEVNIGREGGGKLGDLTQGVKEGTGKLQKRPDDGKVRGKVSATKALARVQGSLSKAEVYAVISKHQQQILRCYEKRLAQKPGLTGKIAFEWTVKTNGSVTSAREVSSSLNDPPTSKCVLGVIKTMKFPKPKGGEVIIKYPFFFQTR